MAGNRPVPAARSAGSGPAAGSGPSLSGPDILLSQEAQAALHQMPSARDKTDELIASWFKHLSPANSEADKRATAQEDRDKRAARAAGRTWSDPGKLADPVKEPTQKTVGFAVSIIASDEIMHAMEHKDQAGDRGPEKDKSQA